MAKKLLQSFAEIEKYFGVAKVTVNRWVKAGAPIVAGGPNDVQAIEEWLKATGAKTQPPDAEKGESILNLSVEKQIADIEWVKVRKQLADFKLMVQRGELMLTEDVERAQVTLANDVKKHLLAVPSANADRILNITSMQEAKQVLSDIVNQVLKVLAKKKGK